MKSSFTLASIPTISRVFTLTIAVNCLFGPFRKHSIGADYACIRSMKLESIVDRRWECRAIE